MAAHRERNDRTRRPSGRAEKGIQGPRRAGPAPRGDWLWGWHPVEAALSNPRRSRPRLLLATPERARLLADRFPGLSPAPSILDNGAIAARLPPGAVHQGVALDIAPLEPLSIEELAEPGAGVILVLDQVTDPQNVGAIFRSAAAFGARGVVLQARHAPALGGALAKAAAGAVDRLLHAEAVNLSRALEQLADLGWRTVGLAGGASEVLADVLDGGPTVLVLGSEGEGIRRLVAEHCDVLAKIPMPGGFESLNVSAATAIALYEASRPR